MLQAAIPIALAGAQAIFGGIQASKGKNILENTNRPTYKIPDEVLKNLSVSERMALQGLPDAQKKAYVDSLQQNLATSLRGLSSRKSGISGISRLNQTQNQAYQNLLAMDAQARQENQGTAMDARNVMAGYKDKQFQFNQVDPYNAKIDEGQALYGAGLQNIFGGLNTAGGIGQMALGNMGDTKSAEDPTAGINSNQLFAGVNDIYKRTKKNSWEY